MCFWACIRLCVRVWMCVCLCASAVSMAGFQSLLILVFLFSPLATPPWITALRLLRSLFLGSLIDMQQPTSHYGVFYALCFCTLSASIVFPFLGSCIRRLISMARFPVFYSLTREFIPNGLRNMSTSWRLGFTLGFFFVFVVTFEHKKHSKKNMIIVTSADSYLAKSYAERSGDKYNWLGC